MSSRSRSFFDDSDSNDEDCYRRYRRSAAPSPEDRRSSHRASTGVFDRGSGSNSDRHRNLVEGSRPRFSHDVVDFGSDRRRGSIHQSGAMSSGIESRVPRSNPREAGRYAAERARRDRHEVDPRERGSGSYESRQTHACEYPGERESRRGDPFSGSYGSRSSGQSDSDPYRARDDYRRRTEGGGSSRTTMSDPFARRPSRTPRRSETPRRSVSRWDDVDSDFEW